MAAGHSVDDYLETIYFLAFPIGEYRPDTKGSPTLAVRVADMLGVSRASAGEMLKRLEGEGLVERGEHKEAILTAEGSRRSPTCLPGPAPRLSASRSTTVPSFIGTTRQVSSLERRSSWAMPRALTAASSLSR